MIVLYILLAVIGGLLLLLLLLSLIPVRAAVRFQEEFSLEVRYLFLRIPILPGKEEAEPEPEPEPEEKPEEPEAEKKPGILDRVKAALKREGLVGFLQGLGELIKLLFQAVGGVLKGLRLKRFDLYLCLGGAGDAAAAAILYGQVSGGVYAACGGLFTLMPCKKKGITVDLNYDTEEAKVDFSMELSILPIFALKEGLVLLLKGLRPLRKIL